MMDTKDTMDLAHAFIEGERNVGIVANGGKPDSDKLVRLAQAMDALRSGVAAGTMCFGWVRPTEEDVRMAFRLVDLVRNGAPQESLIEPAWHVYRVTADPGALYSLCALLPWLAGEPCEDEPSVENALFNLDAALAFFERGGNVAGFVPTPEDAARVRRLRELVAVEGADALEERRRLAAELWARVPQDNVSEGIRRIMVKDG